MFVGRESARCRRLLLCSKALAAIRAAPSSPPTMEEIATPVLRHRIVLLSEVRSGYIIPIKCLTK